MGGLPSLFDSFEGVAKNTVLATAIEIWVGRKRIQFTLTLGQSLAIVFFLPFHKYLYRCMIIHLYKAIVNVSYKWLYNAMKK